MAQSILSFNNIRPQMTIFSQNTLDIKLYKLGLHCFFLEERELILSINIGGNPATLGFKTCSEGRSQFDFIEYLSIESEHLFIPRNTYLEVIQPYYNNIGIGSGESVSTIAIFDEIPLPDIPESESKLLSFSPSDKMLTGKNVNGLTYYSSATDYGEPWIAKFGNFTANSGQKIKLWLKGYSYMTVITAIPLRDETSYIGTMRVEYIGEYDDTFFSPVEVPLFPVSNGEEFYLKIENQYPENSGQILDRFEII